MELAFLCCVVVVLALALVVQAAANHAMVRRVLEHDRSVLEKVLARFELDHGQTLLDRENRKAAAVPARAPDPDNVTTMFPTRPRESGYKPVPDNLDGA